MKKMKRMLATFLCMIFATQPVLAADVFSDSEVTEAQVLQEIKNGVAEVIDDVIDISTITQQQLEEDAGLRSLVNRLPNVNARKTNSGSNTGSIYTTTVTTSSGDVVKYYSTPCFYIKVADVGNTGSSDFSSSMDMINSTVVNGQEVRGWKGYITYKNIVAEIGCGTNTEFTSLVSVDGTHSGSGAMKAVMYAAIAVSGHSTVNAIIDGFNELRKLSSGSVTRYSIAKDNVRALSAEFTGVLNDENDEAIIASSISAEDDLPAKIRANAVARWTYDIYHGLGAARPSASKTYKVTTTYSVG